MFVSSKELNCKQKSNFDKYKQENNLNIDPNRTSRVLNHQMTLVNDVKVKVTSQLTV